MRVSGLTLIGARVAEVGGVGWGGWLAMVVGACTGGGRGAKVGLAAGGWGAGVLGVAGATGTGAAVVLAGAADADVDSGVESVGIMITCAGRAGCSSTMAVAVAAASVAATTPTRTIRCDHRPSSCGC